MPAAPQSVHQSHLQNEPASQGVDSGFSACSFTYHTDNMGYEYNLNVSSDTHVTRAS